MKKIICPFFILIFAFTACEEKKIPKENVKSGLRSELDTFYFGNKLAHVTFIEKAEFDNLSSADVLDTSESNNLLKDSSFVKRIGDTLLFILPNNGKTMLVDNDADEGYAQYKYLGQKEGLDQYIVEGRFYEWFEYILIDKEAGDTTYIINEPILSPDKKNFIAANCDIEAGFDYNGLQLFSNVDHPKKIAQRELAAWGPAKIKWLNNTTILIEGNTLDSLGQQKTEYMKVNWDK